jgi:antitoxin component YwqK of YwqJK toxin-antitoxin module
MTLFVVSCRNYDLKRTHASHHDGSPLEISYYTIQEMDTSLIKKVFFYQNHVKRMEANYQDSVLNGSWTYWYEDGRKNLETEFLDGNRIVDWKIWGFDGQLLAENEYKMEVYPNGLPKNISFFRKEKGIDVLIGEVYFYTNSSKQTEGSYKDNKKHGPWTAWYKNGVKWSQGEFQYNLSHGKRTIWHKNGQKYYEGEYRLGKRIGKWSFWSEDGRLLKELNYDKK